MSVASLARGFVEGCTEFDWEEVDPQVQQWLLDAAYLFSIWAKDQKKVIEPEGVAESRVWLRVIVEAADEPEAEAMGRDLITNTPVHE